MIPIGGTVRSTRPPLVTIALIGLNVLVFLHEAGMRPAQLDALIQTFGLVPLRQTVALQQAPGLLDAWLLPIFTSMFLHGGWAHLIGNMLYLWVFGDGLENRLGHLRFLIFYLLVGVAASQAQVAADPSSPVPMVGASGAIAGVLAGYVILYPRARITMLVPVLFYPLFFELPVLLFGAVWFLEQLVSGTVGTLTATAGRAGGVAWWAHAGGFVGGVLLLPLLLDRRHQGYQPPRYDSAGYYGRRY